MKGQAPPPPLTPPRHDNHNGFILTLLWWAPTLLIPSLADNYVFYLERFYSWHIQKNVINRGAAPLLRRRRGRFHLYICVFAVS